MESRNFLLRLVSILLISLLIVSFLAQVIASHGPEGGGGVMALDPIDRDILYRGGNGLHRSTDGGESWQRIDGPINFSFLDIRINPINPRIMYVWGVIDDIWGMYKSTDGGIDWRLVLRDSYWFDMDRINPETLYAIKAGEGIFKSGDGGDTWERKLEGLGLNSIAVHPIETNTIYVGGSGGVHKSTDWSESWTLMGLEGVNNFQIVLDPVDANTLYARVTYPVIGDRMSRSTDGGQSWDRLPTDLRGPLGIDPKDSRILYIGEAEQPEERGIHKSTDRGKSWRRVRECMPTGNVLVNPSDTRIIYAPCYEGTAKSTDGGESWTIHRRGFVATGIIRVLVAPTDTSRVYASPGRFLSKSTDAGESWSELRLVEIGANIAVDPSNPDTLYGAGYDQGIWSLRKSTDAGDSWFTVLREGIVNAIAIDPNDPSTLYAAGRCNPTPCDVFKSSDAGMNWTPIATLPQVYALVINPEDSQILYAGTRSGIYKSRDGGARWSPSGLSDRAVAGIIIDEKNPQRLFAWRSDGIHSSEDGGVMWNRITTLLVNTLVIDPRDPQILYAGSSVAGVYKSTDGGKTWEPKNQGLTTTSINHLAIAGDTGRLYAATGGAGVWFSDDGAETWE